jgi:DNA repair protein RecN (Recombination protein N)
MLRRLSIWNFAIIERLDLHVQEGFIAITGETGAGKSIVFDAMELAMGRRASAEMIRRGADRAQVEALFSLTPVQSGRLLPTLEEHGCPVEEDLHVKRILTAEGRNRVFVNGSKCSLRALQDIAAGLVDLVGQHAGHQLLVPGSHLRVLDDYAQCADDVSTLSGMVSRFRSLRAESEALEAGEDSLEERRALLQGQLEELRMAGFSEGEDDRLAQSIAKMANAETLRERTATAAYMLQEADGSVLDVLGQAAGQIKEVAQIDTGLEALLETLERCGIELSEAARDLQDISSSDAGSPEEMEAMQLRMDLLHRLKQLHGDIPGMAAAEDRLQGELDLLSSQGHRLGQLRAEADALLKRSIEAAEEIGRRRREAASELEELVEVGLAELGMEGCRFQVDFRPCQGAEPSGLSPRGLEDAEFLISPNIGEGLKPLSKVASGGELSRILLAIKGALIRSDPVGCYLFDEVDTGIGGGVAETVGRKLQKLGATRQAICITHLPQVASCAHHHLHVRKRVEEKRTVSTIRYLTGEERVQELARMLGGADVTDRSLAHAEEMLLLGEAD